MGGKLQDIQYAGFRLLLDCGVAEEVTLRRKVKTVIDPVQEIEIEVVTEVKKVIGHPRRFQEEERTAGLVHQGEQIWVLEGKTMEAKDFRPEIEDEIISPSLGTFVVSEVRYEDHTTHMNWELLCRFSGREGDNIC